MIQPSITIWDFLHIFGAAQGIFFGILFFFHKKGKPLANRFLGILLFAFSFRLLEIVAFWTKYLLVIPHFFAAAFPTAYLFGVLFYFYVYYLISDSQKLKPSFWYHLIPFGLVTLAMLPLYMMGTDAKLELLNNFLFADSFDNAATFSWPVALQFPHILIYLWLTVKLLNKHIAIAIQEKRSTVKRKYYWLRILAIGFGIFYCIWVLNATGITASRPYFRLIDYLSTSAMAIFIYMVGYLAFKIPELHSPPLSNPKYSNSSLTKNTAELHLKKLKQIMVNEKPYLNAELSLSSLSDKLGISPNHLSQILNEHLSQNFFDFVNQYRIEEAKRILSAPASKQFTLSSIAFEVGFNNRTSFNNYFKKITGKTPSKFRTEFNKP